MTTDELWNKYISEVLTDFEREAVRAIENLQRSGRPVEGYELRRALTEVRNKVWPNEGAGPV